MLLNTFSKEILDSLPDIIIITDGVSVFDGNYSFLDFVNCGDIEEFHRNHKAIYELFIDKEGYITHKEGHSWLESVKANRHKKVESKVIMNSSILGENRSFKITYSRHSHNKKLAIISFSDITKMERYRTLLANANKDLEKKVKQRTRDLTKSNKLLEQAERIANLGSWEFDIATQEFLWSEQMYSIYEFDTTSPQSTYDYFFSIVSQKDREQVRDFLHAKVPGCKDFSVVIDGKEKFIACSALQIKNAQGEVKKVLGTHQDITNNIQILKEKEHNDRALIQKSKMAEMGEMIGAIAHQWKQPLNTLGLLVQDIPEALEYNELDTKYAEKFSKQSMDQITYMNQTINDFRDFFKPSKEKKNFNVIASLDSVISLLEGQMQRYRISITKEYDSRKKCMVNGLDNELKQVLINIINNAKDVLTEREVAKREIIAKVAQVDGNIAISIEDNAGGIPKEILPNIFSPYFSTKGEGGTGIGLQIAKTIIEEKMGGKILAYNSDKGAVFKIVLVSI